MGPNLRRLHREERFRSSHRGIETDPLHAASQRRIVDAISIAHAFRMR